MRSTQLELEQPGGSRVAGWTIVEVGRVQNRAVDVPSRKFSQYLKKSPTRRFFIVKLREREGQGVDPGRSLKGHLWMVDGGYPFPDALH